MAEDEVYSPKSLQLWRTVLNWLTFLVQVIFVQIAGGIPSLERVFSFIGFNQSPPFLSTSSSPAFKPLPVVEVPLQLRHPHQQIHHLLQTTPGSSSVDISPVTNSLPADLGPDSHSRLLDKLTVALDLDETLVCAYETSSLPESILTQAREAGLKWFEMECSASEKEAGGKPARVSYVTVFERPGLHEFLKQLSGFANLVLFTAGLEGYARPLVDRIDSENRFCQRLYRPSTTSTEYRDHVKDLSPLTKDLCRVVLVDNNPFSFLLQPLNGIPCVPFSPGQPKDDQLLNVLLPLLKQLSEQSDVRPFLYDKFRMPEWFHKHGIPLSFWPTLIGKL